VGIAKRAFEERAFPKEDNRLFLKPPDSLMTSFKKVSPSIISRDSHVSRSRLGNKTGRFHKGFEF
jgi:hypothetical protein